MMRTFSLGEKNSWLAARNRANVSVSFRWSRILALMIVLRLGTSGCGQPETDDHKVTEEAHRPRTVPGMVRPNKPVPVFPANDVNHEDLQGLSTPTEETRFSAETVKKLRARFPKGKDEIERIADIMRWMTADFEAFSAGGKLVAKRSAQEIFDSGKLSGCNDWGILLASVLRYLGYPVVFMNAAGVEWARRYKDDQSVNYSGHTFLEVWVNGHWIVLDAVSGHYIDDYDPNNLVIPTPEGKKESAYFVYQKGLDHWTMGIKRIQDSTHFMSRFALYYPLESISIPESDIKRLDLGYAL